jgi:hypothetical protein
MRDPDLVQRAERAAIALERAWDRWRTMHGLGPEPSPPVSSYVGYSLEEPWGQPRVVFGVGAEEAERLAGLLDGHDCGGPVYAELAGSADWRRAPVGELASPAWPVDEHLSIPLQALPPAADMLASTRPPDGPIKMAGRAIESSSNDTRINDASVIEAGASPAEVAAQGGVAPSDLRRSGVRSSEAADEPHLAEQAARAGSTPTHAPQEPGPPELVAQELVPLPPLPDQTPAGPAEAAYVAAAPVSDVKRPHGPGYRGPRYRGSPPQYSAARDSAARDRAGQATATKEDSAGNAIARNDSVAQDSAVKDGVPQDSVASDNAAQDSVAQDSVASDNAASDSAGKPTSRNDSGAQDRAAQNSAAPERATPGPDQPPAANEGAAAGTGSDGSVRAGKQERAKPRQTPRPNRTRRQGPGAHEAWESAGEQPADHVI